MQMIDQAWLDANPLPLISKDADKDGRGRILVVGGAEFVPGALRLTGEAALRAGAGKLQMATVEGVAMSLAVLIPEAAMIALPADDDGEIAPKAAKLLDHSLSACDALILGPGMSAGKHTDRLVAAILERAAPLATIILDAAALTCSGDLREAIAQRPGRVVFTPHHGEMRYLTGDDEKLIAEDPAKAAQKLADDYRAIVLLKGARTILVQPGNEPLLYEGGCAGLATGGSGDVLSGIIGGLAARGASPARACGWATFIHGQAGDLLSQQIGTIGFLAREILPLIPSLFDKAGREDR